MNPASSQILITGASRGIGFSIANHFASMGASTVLVATTPTTLTTARDSLAVIHKSQTHTAFAGDVGDPSLWDDIKKAHNNIDVLINAAGIMQASLLVATPIDKLERVLRTNLLGTVLACKAVGRGMLHRRHGCIVNVASVLGLDRPVAGSAVYGASKAGVIGLTRALASEMGTFGVRVNCVVPGYVQMGMTRHMSEHATDLAIRATPLGRVGVASEVAEAVEFLVRNGFANGTEIRLDGGLSFGR